MRQLTSLPLALGLLAGSSALLHAQFQQPTPAELQMTSDPKAPGAAAVYLNLEEKTDDAFHFHSYYARIKVLTEKGKDLATIHVPYEHGQFQVAAIQGRTIHADGTVVPLQAKPADLMTYRGGGHQYNTMAFAMPSVEVGSIIEYRLQIRYGDDIVSSPVWMIQQPYFVHHAHYFFNPATNAGVQVVDKHNQITDRILYSSRLRSSSTQVQEDPKRRFTLDVDDIEPLPAGDYLPPLNTVRESVIFYYSNAQSGPSFWDSEGKYWVKDTERFMGSGALRKAAADLIAPGDSELVKAQKLYSAVMKIDNSDFAPAAANGKRHGNKDAASVWKAQRGTGDEITMLYVAMTRAAGLKAWPMQVVNRDRALFEKTFLSTEQLDDYIAVVQVDGKDMFLDPGQKMCGFGVLHWKHQLATGFRETDKGMSIEETPAEPAEGVSIERAADLTVKMDGSADGEGTITLRRNDALYWRQLALVEGEAAMSKEFSDELASHLPADVRSEVQGFDGLAQSDSDLKARLRFSGMLGASTGKRVILPAFLFESRGKQPFVEQTSREVPIDLQYATMEDDRVTYHLPAGMKADALPHDDDIVWLNRVDLKIKVKAADEAVSLERRFVRNSAIFDPSLYGTLRFMYKRFSAADQQQIVLTRVTETGVK